MNFIMNYLRGNAKIEIYGANPEQYINNLAQQGIPFWKFEKPEPGFARVRIPYSYVGNAERLKRGTNCDIKVVKRWGLPVFANKMKRRWALIIGLILCLLAVPAMSMFVWEIEVSGNETVSTGEIMAVAEKLGVHIGMLGFSIDQQDIRSRALSELRDLSWLTVNIKGTKAEIKVRERIKKPDIIDNKKPAKIVAVKGGIVTGINVFEGAPIVSIGQTVAKGDVLVSSEMPSLNAGTRIVHAMGEIYARTWYDFSYEMPLKYDSKEFTGKKTKKTALIMFGKRINLYFSTGFYNTFCDKIIKSKQTILPGGFALPITVNTETYTQYEPVTRVMDKKEAEEILKKRLSERLDELIGEGEKVSVKFDTKVSGDVIRVTLNAECIEQIGGLAD